MSAVGLNLEPLGCHPNTHTTRVLAMSGIHILADGIKTKDRFFFSKF